MTTGWEPTSGTFPVAPINGQVVSPYIKGVYDLHWDDPSILAKNTSFTLVGVNIYRSDASDLGPYRRINRVPIGGTYYRDQLENELISNEVVRDWVSFGNAANQPYWSFRTRFPIVKKSFLQRVPADNPLDVLVEIDGVRVEVHEVFGPTGEVVLVNTPRVDPITQKEVYPITPTTESVVTVTYYCNRNLAINPAQNAIFYRLTSVALSDETPSGLIETPLIQTPSITPIAVETMDYIWREAIRRNRWILEQGGERVNVFVQKVAGVPCDCGLDPRLLEFSKQPSNRCKTCFGTGFVGGYEGPYPTVIAPDDAERKFTQTVTGRRREHTYEVFMGPSPLMSMRDFIVKQTNERYSVGPVRRPSNRGNLMQQHFNIQILDEADIRYTVPIDGVAELAWPETRSYINPHIPNPDEPSVVLPMETNKNNIPANRQLRGRTPAWENISY